ncbi:MAG TPA: hypothetical protein VLY04_21195 [Bryobacteraceae bacterium]|nr:hypothetical protein [Bryobacteraceae bacterium]
MARANPITFDRSQNMTEFPPWVPALTWRYGAIDSLIWTLLYRQLEKRQVFQIQKCSDLLLCFGRYNTGKYIIIQPIATAFGSRLNH